jgi:hypothetical protein
MAETPADVGKLIPVEVEVIPGTEDLFTWSTGGSYLTGVDDT